MEIILCLERQKQHLFHQLFNSAICRYGRFATSEYQTKGSEIMKNKIKLSACAIGLLTAIQMIAVPGANANPQTCKSYGPPNNAYYKWK
ncbi:MAG: hypothetical protein AB8B97_00090, partial [Granulosicoccus sp.]